MDIQLRDPISKTVEDRLTPKDQIIFRCSQCETFLLPKEIDMLQARKGREMKQVIFLCPVCHGEGLIMLTREQFENTIRMEKANLVVPRDYFLKVAN